MNHKDIRSNEISITGWGGSIGSHLKKALPNADGLDTTKSPTTNICGDILSQSISAMSTQGR